MLSEKLSYGVRGAQRHFVNKPSQYSGGINFGSITMILQYMHVHRQSHYPRFDVPYEGDIVLCSIH